MKYCPKCHANVEGLIKRCDCCGASLDTRKRLFFCSIYDTPACLGFSSLVFRMVEEIETANNMLISLPLDKITLRFICYPDSFFNNKKISKNIYYYSKTKSATVTITVDYDQYIYADSDEKANIVSKALLRGMGLLKKKLLKHDIDITHIEERADNLLSKYKNL